MNPDWTGKLQVKLLFTERDCAHTLSKWYSDIHSEKMKAKYMKEDVWKSFFRKLAG